MDILEARYRPDHIHMLVEIELPPHISAASLIGCLKSKSSRNILGKHAKLKCKYGNEDFWRRGYYENTVGRNKRAIEEYVKSAARRYWGRAKQF